MVLVSKNFLFIFILTLCTSVYGQSILDRFGSGTSTRRSSDFSSSSLSTERIERISDSRRIFVISNDNQSFSRGDYISLVLGDDLAVRALVAQTTDDNKAGIKILKIYSLTQWNRLREGREVQVIRGDDTAFINARSELSREEEEDFGMIRGERDLFDETTFLEDDLIFSDASDREISQDNVVSIYLGLIEGIDTDGSSRRYQQLNGSWAYQFQDNIWGEISYGRTVINDFPSTTLDTVFSNITFKVKYTVPAPFFSYLLPYVGYQILDASSPDAGVPDPNNPDTDLDAELRRLDDIKRSDLVFGVTLLKRLVPGWFLRADLGSDLISAGFALEF